MGNVAEKSFNVFNPLFCHLFHTFEFNKTDDLFIFIFDIRRFLYDPATNFKAGNSFYNKK